MKFTPVKMPQSIRDPPVKVHNFTVCFVWCTAPNRLNKGENHVSITFCLCPY